MSARKVPDDTVDRSRGGNLVHDARSSGRTVTVVAYVEGGAPGAVGTKHAIESTIICRTQEQATAIATLLRDARASAFARDGGSGVIATFRHKSTGDLFTAEAFSVDDDDGTIRLQRIRVNGGDYLLGGDAEIDVGFAADPVDDGAREMIAQAKADGADCAGAGRCHGSMKWCDVCGDVRATCDTIGCDVHTLNETVR